MLDKFCVYAKIYGERNSGTNFMQDLIRTNFAVHCLQDNNRIYDYLRVMRRQIPKDEQGRFRSALTDLDCARVAHSDFGWKHGVPPLEIIATAAHANHTLFICMAKHPVAWLRSLAKRPYNPLERPPRKFSALIRHEWSVAARDNLKDVTRINAVDLWNVKNAGFVRVRSIAKHCIVTSYENVLADPAGFLSGVANHLLTRKDEFEWSLPSTKGTDADFEDYRRKYELARVCEKVSTEDLDFIRQRVDPAVMEAFAYEWPPAS